jgi:transposase
MGRAPPISPACLVNRFTPRRPGSPVARWRFPRRDSAMLEARRLEGFALLRSGLRPAEVSRRLSVSRTAVGRWRRRALIEGETALRSRPRTGRPTLVDRRTQGGLARILSRDPRRCGLPRERWTLSTVADAAHRSWGHRYSRGGIWRMLRAQGFRWRPDGTPPPTAAFPVPPSGNAPPGIWAPGRRVLRLMDPRRTRRLRLRARRPLSDRRRRLLLGEGRAERRGRSSLRV